jgi:predicted permease
MAIRTALGSGRAALIRQQVIESLLICTAAAALGIALAALATNWLTARWTNMPRAETVHPDGLVLVFAVGITFLAGILAGLMPAISAADELLPALQNGNRGTTGRAGLRKILLTTEVALTVVLLVGAGLLLKSFLRLHSIKLGCATDNILTLTYFLRGDKYAQPEQIVAFHTRLLDEVRHLPGVNAAGLTMVVPGGGYYGDSTLTIPEHPPSSAGEFKTALFRTADPGYFSAMKIPLIQGRFFSDDERLNRDKFVIVNQDVVKEFFPNEDPIGKHLRVAWRTMAGENYEIVGVVGDTLWQLGQPIRPMMWFPILSGIPNNSGDAVLVVRSNGDVTSLALPIQKAIAQIDPDLPVKEVLTMDEILGRSTEAASFDTTLISAFAVVSLLLAAVGLFGVLSYIVAQRTTEIGIRIALGARRDQVIRLMLRDGLTPAIVGLAFGLIASAAVTRLIKSMLYHTEALDPAVFFAVSAILLLVAALACAVPAWRASRLDPMQALRSE